MWFQAGGALAKETERRGQREEEDQESVVPHRPREGHLTETVISRVKVSPRQQ